MLSSTLDGTNSDQFKHALSKLYPTLQNASNVLSQMDYSAIKHSNNRAPIAVDGLSHFMISSNTCYKLLINVPTTYTLSLPNKSIYYCQK